MDNLLKIEVNENQEQVVSGRLLHTFLEVKERYNDWFNRMLDYGFEEHKDYSSFTEKTVKPQGGRPSINHTLKLSMAKELCMLARNERGKQARQYFIKCEEAWNSPEMIKNRALSIMDMEIKKKNAQILELTTTNQIQAQQIAEFKPMKEYVDKILSSTDTVTTTQIAADYGLSGKGLNKILHDEGLIHKVGNQWILYKAYMNKGYTKSQTIDIMRTDGRIETIMHTKWTQKGRLKIHEILTKLGYQANFDRFPYSEC